MRSRIYSPLMELNMKQTIKAFALMALFGMAVQGLAVTNTWWTQDFDGVADMVALTNETYSTAGLWTTQEDDDSVIFTEEGNSYIKLDTQNNNLTWTPAAASTEEMVLIDAKMYLVGSDSDPQGFDPNADVQGAVYLRNYIDEADNSVTGSVLCVYASQWSEDLGAYNTWVELAGPAIEDSTWHDVRVVVDYTISGNYFLHVYVDGVKMVQAADTTVDKFPIANPDSFLAEGKQKVSSVSFRGTGAVDNFVGYQVIPEAAPQVTFGVEAYVDEVEQADATAYLTGTTTDPVNIGDTAVVAFLPDDGAGKNLSLVRYYKDAETYVDFVVTNDGEGTVTVEDTDEDVVCYYDEEAYFGVVLEIPTTGMTEESAPVVVAYYGTNPAVVVPSDVAFTLILADNTTAAWSTDGVTWTPYAAGAQTPAGTIQVKLTNADGVEKIVSADVSEEASEFDFSEVAYAWADYLGEAVDGAYQIDDEADLVLFRSGIHSGLVTEGETFVLTADVALTSAWPGIGIYMQQEKSVSFNGTFDGQGYTISDVVFANETVLGDKNKYRGFFNQVWSATIQNVTIVGSGFEEAATTGSHGGALLAGHVCNSFISNVVTKGSITGNHNVAGVVARANRSTIVDCVNEAAVSSSYTKMAGIVAFAQDSTGTAKELVNLEAGLVIIENCVNKGTVTVLNGSTAGRDGTGGIVGWNGDYDAFQVKNCSNEGEIVLGDAISSTAQVGQIYGGRNGVPAACTGNSGRTDFVATVNDTDGLNYAIVVDDVANYVADADLLAGDTYLVTVAGVKPSIALAEDEWIAFDATLAAFIDTGITAAEGLEISVSTEGNVSTYTATAPAPAVTYPDYIVQAEGEFEDDFEARKAKFDAWVENKAGEIGRDTDSSWEAAFLLDVAPNAAAVEAAQAAFKITALSQDQYGEWVIEVAGEAFTGDGAEYGNGFIVLEKSSQLDFSDAVDTADNCFFRVKLVPVVPVVAQ